jgi:DNA-directed RNA polymerase subunit P
MEATTEEATPEAPSQQPPARERNPGGLFYECINCGSRLTADQLAMTPEIKCPFCGYRILRKVRPPIVKHVKAR